MKIKRTLAMALVLAMMVGMLVFPASAVSLSDVAESHWGYQSICRWIEAGVLNGYPTDSGKMEFRPNNSITRAEFAKVLSTTLGLSVEAENKFPDLGDKWYTPYVLRCNAAGIMKGDEQGRVNPEARITREQAFAMMARALDMKSGKAEDLGAFGDSANVSGWAVKEASAVVNYKAVLGNDKMELNPKDNITRAEVVKILDRIIAVHVSKTGKVTTTSESEQKNAGNFVLVSAEYPEPVSVTYTKAEDGTPKVSVQVAGKDYTAAPKNGMPPAAVTAAKDTPVELVPDKPVVVDPVVPSPGKPDVPDPDATRPETPVTLKIWFHGSTVTSDASAKVMGELNKYLGEKINVTLEPIWGTWGDFDEATTKALAAGDDVDMYFTCNWSANEYNKYAKDGYWVKLDDLLKTKAPELLDTVPNDIWETAKTNGADGWGVYAVPGLKDTAAQICWDVNATLLTELGFEVPEKLDYYSDEFAAMMQAAKDAKGDDFYPLLIEPAVLERMVNHSAIVTGDLIGNSLLSYYYDAAHPSKDIGSKIVNKFATPEFEKFAAKTYEYSQKGYINPGCQQVATANDTRTVAQATGEYLFGTQYYAFGCEKDFSSARGIDVRMIPETAAYMDCTSGQGAMIAVSKASKNPERAVMFLNLLNTDPTVMTMLNYGLEGFTYTNNGDGTITFINEARATYSPWRNGMGNIRILPPINYEGVGYWDRFSAYYDAAEVLPYGGFIFDRTVVENEGKALSNVYAEYAFNLMSGAVDPAAVLPEFLKELDAAGAEKFVSEANRQMDAYMTSH